MANTVYASGDFTCMWNGVKLNSGWGNDVFLTVTPNGPMKDIQMGACGTMSVSKMADMGGEIQMTFMQTADALNDINLIAAAEMLVGEAFNLPYFGVFTFYDPTGNCPSFFAYNTVLTDRGVHTHQKVMGEQVITWKCEKLIYGDPASITANILDFIKD